MMALPRRKRAGDVSITQEYSALFFGRTARIS
jgi:hypothetical protein